MISNNSSDDRTGVARVKHAVNWKTKINMKDNIYIMTSFGQNHAKW